MRPLATLLGLLLSCAVAAAQEGGAEPPTPPPPGFLGVSTQAEPIPGREPPLAWARIVVVHPGTPAARAGLQVGDLIVAVDGAPLEAPPNEVPQRLAERIRVHPAGDTVKLTIRRATVAVRVARNEEPLGEETELSGPRAQREGLPDLGALLHDHAGDTIHVRARSYQREREWVIELGQRPMVPSLPENAALRPDLEALPLDPGAALAERALALWPPVDGQPVAASLGGLLQRFEDDERQDDAWRLRTVRYLHRAPLRLPGATRRLGADLERAIPAGPRGGLDHPALMTVARELLDAPAAVGSGVAVAAVVSAAPTRPAPGSDPNAYAWYAQECLRLARARVELALAPLSAEERATLARDLPSVADRFVELVYLHQDEDVPRWERHAEAIRLAARVDRGALLAALEALLPWSEAAFLEQVRTDLRAAEARGAYYQGGVPAARGRFLAHLGGDPVGDVLIGSSDANEYRLDAAAIIDLDGDDRYHERVAGARPDRPAALLIDLGGDDRYQANAPFAQGAALLGAALLVDLQGNDRYTASAPFAQGAALCGAALLIDGAGDDELRAHSYAQGAALCQGLGALVDLEGDDRCQVGIYGQGFAGPGAFGALLARGGDDRYAALGDVDCTYGDAGTFHAVSQGAAFGFRQVASAGVAVLLDVGGCDSYEAGNFSQGCGYYFGWGSLIDLSGGEPSDDVYEGSRYAQAAAAHSALGSLLDDAGDDRYRGWVGAEQSAAWDLSVTAFLEDAGNDRYEPGPGFSIGAAAHNGFSLFVDLAGRDRYLVGPGQAGPNDYHGGPSVAVFLDAGGEPDEYQGGGLADGALAAGGQAGLRIDLPGPLAAGGAFLEERLAGQ